MQPPKPDSVARLADALGLSHDPEETATLLDLAYAGRGQIPASILSDSQLVAKLPVLFRTLRGEPNFARLEVR